MRGPVKLAIRANEKENYISATVMTMPLPGDPEVDCFILSTINLNFCDDNRDHYESWVKTVSEIFRLWVESKVGVDVSIEVLPPSNPEDN